jgi:hypothetical protein
LHPLGIFEQKKMIDEESPAIFGGCVQPLPFCAAACSYCLVVCAHGSVQHGCMQLSKNSSVAHIGLIDSSHCKQLCMQLADITQSIGSALLHTFGGRYLRSTCIGVNIGVNPQL